MVMLTQVRWIEVSSFIICATLKRDVFKVSGYFLGFVSLSTFHPPDTSHASHGDDFQKRMKQENKEPISESTPSTSTTRSLTIEEEITRLRAQLPPIDFEAAAVDTFEEFETLDGDGEAIECTCTFREEITYLSSDEDEKPVDSVQEPEMKNSVNVKNGVNEKLEDSDEDETDDFCAVDDIEDEHLKSPPPMRGAVKSIFDPEYDANENLIEEMVRRKPRVNATKVIEVKIEKGAVKPLRIEPQVLQPEPVPQVERVPIINYVCEEDPMCRARAHFQRDPVTDQDVDRLHKTFISGLNGYWNGIPEVKPTQDYKKDMENIDYAKHLLWKRVVPRYDFLTGDKLPKTDQETRIAIPPPPQDEVEDNKSLDDFKTKTVVDFREWHEVMNVRSLNDDVLTILPYVIID